MALAALTLTGAVAARPEVAAADTGTATTAAAPNSWLDTSNRASVLAAFEAMQAAVAPASGWNGDLATCRPGTTSAEHRAAVLARINFYRSLAGVPPVVVENPTLSAKAQQAALMHAAQNSFDRSTVFIRHTNIPTTTRCYTAAAAEAADRSNLYVGHAGIDAIGGFIEDPGPGNTHVGHRNWFLLPSLTEVGIGDVTGPQPYSTNAIWVVRDMDHSLTPVRQSSGFVAWPSTGYFPGALVKSDTRWSFSVPMTVASRPDMTGATVTIVSSGVAVPVTVTHRSPKERPASGPMPTVTWTMPGIDLTPDVDTTYTITIEGVRIGNQPKSYTYTTTLLGDQPAPPAQADIDYVTRAYIDFIDRAPSTDELANGVAVVTGAGRATFVRTLANSDAWISHVVEIMYNDTLGRSSDTAGSEYWVGKIRSGTSVADVASAFYGSPEYVTLKGGTYDGWVTDLYAALLSRSPDTAGLEHWRNQAGRIGTQNVAGQFYQSEENRRVRVTDLYRQLLGRDPDPAGLAHWSQVLANGNDLALATALAASDEYYGRANR